MSNDPYNDGTTTRWHKVQEMAGGINLRNPVRSIRRHQQARTRTIVFCVALALVVALAARFFWRAYGV